MPCIKNDLKVALIVDLGQLEFNLGISQYKIVKAK